MHVNFHLQHNFRRMFVGDVKDQSDSKSVNYETSSRFPKTKDLFPQVEEHQQANGL